MQYITTRRRGAIWWTQARIDTNLEKRFVSVAVAHVPRPFPCVDETVSAARKLASAEVKC